MAPELLLCQALLQCWDLDPGPVEPMCVADHPSFHVGDQDIS